MSIAAKGRRDLVKKGRRNLFEEESRGGSSEEFQVAFFCLVFQFQVVGFVSGDCMYVTVEALHFWLWVFCFSQFQAVSVLDFFRFCAI